MMILALFIVAVIKNDPAMKKKRKNRTNESNPAQKHISNNDPAPASFDQRFVVIQAKLGDTVRLDCNATGDQPLQVNWFREGAKESLEKHGNSQYDVHESLLGYEGQAGLSSQLEIRQVTQEDGQLYKCLAKNEFGSSERLIKLIVLDAPEKPNQLRVRDIWSRSALISWQAAHSSTGRITNFTVQYWRKSSPFVSASSSGPLQQGSQAPSSGQNHRRESLTVDGLQTSALIVNLMPALTYEISVISQNQVGQSEPSDPINITTSEEEPSAPPSDILVEARGSTSLRVAWKVPPIENHNGRLIGFYVGYRPKATTGINSHSVISSNSLALAAAMQLQQHTTGNQNNPTLNQQQAQQQQPAVFSYKTAEAIDGLQYYDIFLTYLRPATDYEVTVRATNKAGSGPDCHTIVARTNNFRLPQAPSLHVHRIGSNSVQLKWNTNGQLMPAVNSATSNNIFNGNTNNNLVQQQLTTAISKNGELSTAITAKYLLFYQQFGERDWYDLAIETTSQSPLNRNGLMTDSLISDSSLALIDQSDSFSSANSIASSSSSTASVDMAGGHSNLHTLSNLKPNQQYRIYVCAVNEYGIGDPSNVVTVKTEPSSLIMGGTASLSQQQPILLDSLGNNAQSSSSSGFFSGLWSSSNPNANNPSIQQQNHQGLGFVFTSLSSIVLVCILILLIGYLVWQRHFKHRYNSSSASSYPSSWTQATGSDTFRSEYSIKRLPYASQPIQKQQQHQQLQIQYQRQLQKQQHQLLEAQDEAVEGRQRTTMHIATRMGNANDANPVTNNGASNGVRRELVRGLNHSGLLGTQTTRPLISNQTVNHYHQPADLMSGTMQLGGPRGSRNKSHQLTYLQSQQNQAGTAGVTSSTLNRNHQHRQLPPIPYSTLSVKEIQSTVPSKGWRAIPTGNLQTTSTTNQMVGMDNSNQHQNQQLQQAGNAIGSQSPLIYGVIE